MYVLLLSPLRLQTFADMLLAVWVSGGWGAAWKAGGLLLSRSFPTFPSVGASAPRYMSILPKVDNDNYFITVSFSVPIYLCSTLKNI